MDQNAVGFLYPTAAALDGLRARIKVQSIDLVEKEPGAKVMAKWTYGVGELFASSRAISFLHC